MNTTTKNNKNAETQLENYTAQLQQNSQMIIQMQLEIYNLNVDLGAHTDEVLFNSIDKREGLEVDEEIIRKHKEFVKRIEGQIEEAEIKLQAYLDSNNQLEKIINDIKNKIVCRDSKGRFLCGFPNYSDERKRDSKGRFKKKNK